MEWLLLLFIAPYLLLISRISKYLAKVKPHSGPDLASVFASVIIACRNEEKHLPFLIESLSLQDYPPELFEIIIVDDNSTDRTPGIVSQYKTIHNLSFLKNKGNGKKTAIRTGIHEAKGNLLVTTDADCVMQKGWIRSIARFYDEHKPDLIVCPVKLEGGKGFFQKFQELEFLSLQGITAGTALEGNPVMCNGANLAFTRKAYDESAELLHDELTSGDDVFLLHAVKGKKGNRIMWLESSEATVKTMAPVSLGAFLRQRKRWLSKAGSYSDGYTIMLGLSTFLAVLLQGILLPVSIAIPRLLVLYAAVFILKSIPDFLILLNTAKRTGNKKLLAWFIPCQLIYPYYVLTVAFLQVCRPLKKQAV